MSYINSEGEKETPIMIHRALLGSLERFFGILIEHYAGKFPFFLAPSQIVILPIKMNHIHHAKELKLQLKLAGFRVDVDQSDEKVGYKIRNAITQKIPYMIVLGEKEIESKTLSVRSRDNGQLDPMNNDEFIKYLNIKYKKMFNFNSISV
jgi:threonyl-tRNA synthetase